MSVMGFAEPVIGRAFARPGGSNHPTFLTTVECAGSALESAAPKIEFRKQSQADLGRPDRPRERYRFRRRANQCFESARLTADEGRWPSSRTCGEMRWTRKP